MFLQGLGAATHGTDPSAAVEGRNAVLVRQVDTLGNVSASTRFEFTLDRAAPGRPVVWASLSEVGRPTGQVRVDRAGNVSRAASVALSRRI